MDHSDSPPRLAVYGSLAPGRRHHDQVAHLGGTWQRGVVHGRVLDRGWSDGWGYPGFVPEAGGPAVEVMVLSTPHLTTAWGALDDFEGAEYRRIVVPVEMADGSVVRAQIYALRPGVAGG